MAEVKRPQHRTEAQESDGNACKRHIDHEQQEIASIVQADLRER